MILLVIPLVLAAVLVGVQFGWQWVLAPALGVVIFVWAITSLRSMAPGSGPGGGDDTPVPVGPDERTLYWCETCGAELLLLVRGSTSSPRHCGARMHERTELMS